ncbi:MAG: hypothetical protein CMG26_01065 [Candidatus Marinimicrobia bacterium]|nr:hypothetical protein [Candidatus Neomarinimicrobiota bacterium]
MISRIVDNPVKTLFILFTLTIGFAYYAFFSTNKLIVDFSLEQMFPENDPERDKYDQFRSEFSREDDKFLLIYSCDDPLSRENIKKLSVIDELINKIVGIQQTTSLSNIQENDEFLFDEALDDSTWEAHKEMVLDHPLYTNLVISEDGKSGAIFVDMKDDVNNQTLRENLFKEIDRGLEIHGRDWDWYEAGIPVLRTRYVELVSKERSIFIPLGGLVVILILFFVFRQVNCVVLPMTSIFITLIWVSALMAYLGITINLISYLTYILILIIGCSNCIHILMKYHECVEQEDGNIKLAVQRVIKELGGALFLTSLTTAVGFFSLMMTNIRITQEFGFVLGVGVVLMFIVAIITIPIILLYLPSPPQHHIKRLISQSDSFSVDKIDASTKKFPYPILALSILFLIISFIGLKSIDYNISILDDLRPGNSLYDDIMYVDKNFGGTLPLEIVISNFNSSTTNKDSLSLDNIFNLDFLTKADEFESKIEQISHIKKAISMNDYIKVIANFWEPERGMSLPEYDDDIYDYLDLAPSNIGTNLFNSDSTKYRITCRVGNIRSKVADSLKVEVQSIFDEVFKGGSQEVLISGSTLLALRTQGFLIRDLTTSFILAFIIIFISMVILFRSIRLSLISILPTIIPLVAAAAIMGFSGIKLRPSTAMTFSIALGIAVDDTIHFLARFRQELKKTKDVGLAVSNSILSTGKAIIGTTLVLCMGFFTLYFSELVPNHEFGILATIILIIALISSLLLLPVLLNLFYKHKLK